MDFDVKQDFDIFQSILIKRPEINPDNLKKDLNNYYLPFIQKLIKLKLQRNLHQGIIVGVSAIQGAGKTTQGEILEILLEHLGYSSIPLSIDDHYITHEELNRLRVKDPRFIRRGVTHDIPKAIKNLTDLKNMKDGMEVKIPIYDKGAKSGDGDRVGFRTINQKPHFIFYDGWMLGAKRVEDESIFESGLPALDTSEHIQFAKDINRKLDEYIPLWDLIDFMLVLYVLNYQISLTWREQAEERLRAEGKGMSQQQIKEFVYYFWRSVHPAIQIKNLAYDKNTDQVVIINDDHTIGKIMTPKQVKMMYP
ncbi:glycerate kinase [Candidatus Daviesbacteria bacterium]|nr:glycerate kinase [Candidatus Daviesbacteria bacterium]MBI4038563.1 glycerate kinase [Candidatus Daviesbacteria bacterium]